MFRRTLAALLLGTLLTGCYTTKIYVAPRDVPSGQTSDHWVWNLFWGLWTVGQVDAAGACSNDVKSVTADIGILGLVVSGLTGGVVTPIHVEVQCVKPGQPG